MNDLTLKKYVFVLSALFLIILTQWNRLTGSGTRFEIGPRDLEIDSIKTDGKRVLSNDEFRKDIAYLIYALENAYSGKIVHPGMYHEMIARFRHLSEEAPQNISRSDFSAKIHEILQQFPDEHLGVSDANVAVPIPERKIANVSTSKDESCGSEATVKIEKVRGKRVLVVRIPTFFIRETKNQDYFMSLFVENLKSADVVVVDLRGNGGGFQNIPLALAAHLWGEIPNEGSTIQDYPMPVESTGIVVSPASIALMRNYNKFQGIGEEFEAEINQSKDDVSKLFRSLIDLNTVTTDIYNFESTVEVSANNVLYTGHNYEEFGFKGPIYAITDSGCVSACERFIEALEENKNFKTIGQTTKGGVQFGYPTLLRLPESHVDIWVPITYVTYKDKRNVERVGYKPSIEVGDDENSMQKLMSIL